MPWKCPSCCGINGDPVTRCSCGGSLKCPSCGDILIEPNTQCNCGLTKVPRNNQPEKIESLPRMLLTALSVGGSILFLGKEIQMRTVTISVETYDRVTWPSSCPACGIQIKETEGITTDIEVKKGIKATFASQTPKKITVRLCPRCGLRVSWAKKIRKYGWEIFFFFLLFSIIRSPNQFNWTSVNWTNAAYLFGCIIGLVGGILGWLVTGWKKWVVGLQIKRVSKHIWDFRFRNYSFANLFLTANQALVRKE